MEDGKLQVSPSSTIRKSSPQSSEIIDPIIRAKIDAIRDIADQEIRNLKREQDGVERREDFFLEERLSQMRLLEDEKRQLMREQGRVERISLRNESEAKVKREEKESRAKIDREDRESDGRIASLGRRIESESRDHDLGRTGDSWRPI